MDTQKSSPSTYQTPAGSRAYLDFIEGEDGQIHRQIIGQAVLRGLNTSGLTVLDAACGSGWLTETLAQNGHLATGMDSSQALIDYAKKKYPARAFTVSDITEQINQPEIFFDAAILSCASLDISNLEKAYENIFKVLKQNGRFISIIVNPYYASPVGKWKRGIKKLFGGKPRLELSDYGQMAKNKNREFADGIKNNTSYLYTLPEQINFAVGAGFSLTRLEDILSEADSKRFNLLYRLFRFPLYILCEFKKA